MDQLVTDFEKLFAGLYKKYKFASVIPIPKFKS